MHLVPSFFGSKIRPLHEKILPEIANIGFIEIMSVAQFGVYLISFRIRNTNTGTTQHNLGPAKARFP
jgi:hypothetical protein